MAVPFGEERLRRECLDNISALTPCLAHEIKNSLQAVSATLCVMAEKELAPETVDLSLRSVREELKRCEDYVADYLRMSNWHSEPPSPCDVERLLEQMLQLLRPHFFMKKVTLVKRWADNLPITLVSELALRQIVLNLLLNAIDACSPAGEVVLGAESDGKKLLVFVEDNGPGVAPERRQEIFRPFYTTKAGGSGLGLYICVQLAEANNGRLVYLPRSAGGSRFQLELPLL